MTALDMSTVTEAWDNGWNKNNEDRKGDREWIAVSGG